MIECDSWALVLSGWSHDSMSLINGRLRVACHYAKSARSWRFLSINDCLNRESPPGEKLR